MKNPLQLVLLFAIFIFLFAGFFHPINAFTQDLGRHVITGKLILTTFSIPKTNFFSYTYPEFPFINHHWFSEVMFYGISRLFGFNGLLLLTTSLILLSYGLLVFSIRKKITAIPLALISLLYFRVLFERTDLRPEIFSFLFLSLFIVILYKFREHPTRLIFLLPLLELLWVNTHIYFFIGLVVIGLFLIDQIIMYLSQRVHATKFSHVASSSTQSQGSKEDTWSIAINKLMSNATRKFSWQNNSKISILSLILLTCTAFSFLNPNGISGALYPLNAFQNYGYQIEENQNIFLLWTLFQKPTILFFVLSVILLFVSLLVSIRKTKPIDWLLAITFTLAGVIAVRNFPLFVFATFIPAVTACSFLYERLMKKFSFLASPVIPLLLLFVVAWQIMLVTQTKGFGLGVATGATHAADFFLANKIHGPIFNNFDIGSYLDYRLYGRERVFIDGRPEAYPAVFFQETYIPMQQNQEKFDTVVKKYKINAIFFAHTDQTPWANTFLKDMMNHKQWQPIYLDDTVIIFVKKNARNKTLITKFGMTPQTLTAKNIDPNNATSLLYLASFFNKTGLIPQEKTMYQKILALDPTNCPVLRNLTIYLTQENNPAAPIYEQRFLQHCR